ncbi:hypothetical protein VCR26J2_420070 [Vibrio coralliirubri]|nr:hypothetical protein VCR6J2_380065 [Vibrio coralliirubri]CDT37750.1 hypothetical protein VCR1J2_450044 [Vibrio coralliirubri]CDT85875.1 hypothetical protein VCR26J2_420070 [Vibrio coralliirubri]CDT91667.1 hypothetical protein VCR8J2_450043 [Vibrio coralliirubri]
MENINHKFLVGLGRIDKEAKTYRQLKESDG